jgi:hypothetical protein
MNRRAFLLGLLGAAPAAAVASDVAAGVKPSGINDAIREAGRYWGPEWLQVPTARYVMSVREVMKYKYVGEPIIWSGVCDPIAWGTDA